jgi:hypothetical protein
MSSRYRIAYSQTDRNRHEKPSVSDNGKSYDPVSMSLPKSKGSVSIVIAIHVFPAPPWLILRANVVGLI